MSVQALYDAANVLYWKISERQNSTHLAFLKHQNTKTSLYKLSKNHWAIALFLFSWSVRRELQFTVYLDHPVSWHFVIKVKNIIFVTKTRNYDIFVAKIYAKALIDSFWTFAGLIASVSIFGRRQCKLPVATHFFPIPGSAPFHLPHSCQLAYHNCSKYTGSLQKNDFLKLLKPICGRSSGMMTDDIRYSVTLEADEWPGCQYSLRSGMKSDDYQRLVQNQPIKLFQKTDSHLFKSDDY